MQELEQSHERFEKGLVSYIVVSRNEPARRATADRTNELNSSITKRSYMVDTSRIRYPGHPARFSCRAARHNRLRESKTRLKSIAVPEVTVHSKLIANHNVLSVAVGTNCPQGGDTGHGGRTLFRLKNEGSTDIRIRVDGKDLPGARSIEIILGGDAEAKTFTEALEFAARILREQLGRGREEIG